MDGQTEDKVFAYWGVWEGARLREKALTAFAYPDAVEFVCQGEAKSESDRADESLGTFFFQISFVVPYLDFGKMNAAEYFELFSCLPVKCLCLCLCLCWCPVCLILRIG
jgi:hypothetical protein